MKSFYFVSGLPRSGSTLLCNILAQNPRFHSTQTSGCLDVLFGVRNNWDHLIEHQAAPNPIAKSNVLRNILTGYYSHIDRPIIIEKSRGWTAYIEMAEEILQSQVKILVPVRNLSEVLASMEVLHRNTSKYKQPPGEAENYFAFQTVEGRCEYWCQANNLVGLAWNRIQDAIRRGFLDRLHFVEFKELTENPNKELANIYNFLGEEPFNHDFNNVEQVTKEDDTLHGYIGLHTIRSCVEPVESKADKILGSALAEKYRRVSWSL